MTDEELDKARAEEAVRVVCVGDHAWGVAEIAQTAARLAREGWEPVDPFMKEALVIAERVHNMGWFGKFSLKSTLREGLINCALEGLRRGIELGKSGS